MINDPEVRYQEMLTKIQERGKRLTSHRIALLSLISVSDGHPSAMQLYEKLRIQFPTISLATIYKTIALLKEKGEVLEIDLPSDNHYDGNKPYPHPHLICIQCNRIMDGEDMPALLTINKEITELYKFKVHSQQLIFYGVCEDCQITAD